MAKQASSSMQHRPSPGARFVRALRAFATLVALVLVGAQLASIGHHVLVAHYLCAKHGTLHHGNAPEARATERAAGPAALPSGSDDHGNYDDCVFPARTPAELAAVALVQVVAMTFERGSDLATSLVQAERASIPLLALAPKLSPPRA